MKTREGDVDGSRANVLNGGRREALLEGPLDLRVGGVVFRQRRTNILPNPPDREPPPNASQALINGVTCRFGGRQHAASLGKEREPRFVQIDTSGRARE